MTYAVLAVRPRTRFISLTPFVSPASCMHRIPETESRMLARDLLKVSVLYLPLLFTTLMFCAMQKH
jgi:protoheme IX farnesyltransferase